LKRVGQQNSPLIIDFYEVRFKAMSEEHKMTSKDKLVLGITLATIFGGTFVLGLVGLIFNLSS